MLMFPFLCLANLFDEIIRIVIRSIVSTCDFHFRILNNIDIVNYTALSVVQANKV